jgi:RNA polymerase primary sigma factor
MKRQFIRTCKTNSMNTFKPASHMEVAAPGQNRLEFTGPERSSPMDDLPAVIPFPEAPDETGSKAHEFGDIHPVKSTERDTLHLYLQEISQVKLLTREEETSLAKRVRRGDKQAREQMITANLRLVVKISRDYEGLGLPLLDLINEGNIGLIKGVERFDHRKGAKLSYYASWWIKQSIMRALANQSRTIRLPVHVVDKVASIRRAETSLRQTLGRDATDHEIADQLGIRSARSVGQLRDASRRPLGLEAPLGTDSDSPMVSDLVADPNTEAPFEQLVKENDRTLVQRAFKSLSGRESTIIKLRFGLDDKRPKTLEEIARKFGITRERIRQLQNLALVKMRQVIQAQERPQRI